MSQKELSNRVVKVIAEEINILQSHLMDNRMAEITPLRNKMTIPVRYDTRFQKKSTE